MLRNSKALSSLPRRTRFTQLNRTWKFCTSQQLNFNTNPDDISEDTLRLVKQKELLDDANVQRKWSVNHEKKEQSYRERVQAKLNRSLQRGNYPEILRQINESQSGERIIELVRNHIKQHSQRKQNVLDILDQISSIKTEISSTDSSDSDSISDPKAESNSKSDEPRVPRNPSVITHAMRHCFTLNDFESGYKLYEMGRSMNCVSNDLYSQMISGKMLESNSLEALNQCFSLFDEWKEEQKSGGLPITAKIYAALIAACLKINNFGKGFYVYNKLILQDLSDDQIAKTVGSSSIRLEIINLYCKARGVEEAIMFMSDCKTKYGALPTQNMIATMIAQCSKEVRANPHLLDIAETLFKTAFDVSSERGTKHDMIEMSVFGALLQVYCKVGDYKSCIDILERMDRREHGWPGPSMHCISPCIKAISMHNLIMDKKRKNGEESGEERLTEEEKWKLIGHIVDIQKRNNLKTDVITYSVLFHSCDGDRNKLKELYKEMVEVDGITPNGMALQNILLGGLDDFMRQIEADKTVDNENDIREWIDFVLSQHKKYNLPVTTTFRYRLNTKLSIIQELREGARQQI